MFIIAYSSINMDEEYKPEYRMIDVGDLKLDIGNPRLPKSLQEKGIEEEDILNYMLLDASLLELMVAIATNGFFPGEQLLVVKDPKDQKYKVIEGNRRFSAVTLLNHPEKARVMTTQVQALVEQMKRPAPKEIPCLIFDKEEGIHTYLGYRHITGIKEWKLLQKARYLFTLRTSLFKELSIPNAAKEIAKVIGSRKDYVARILVGFQIYKAIEDHAFFKIPTLDDTNFFFNYIADSLNKSNITEFLGVDLESEEPAEKLNLENLELWSRWLFEKVNGNRSRMLGDSQDLGDLNLILGHPEAKEKFINDNISLAEAKEMTGETDDRFMNAFVKALEALETADGLVVKVQKVYSGFEDDRRAMQKLIKKITAAIDQADED